MQVSGEKHIALDNAIFSDGTDHWDFQEMTTSGNQLYAMSPIGILVGSNADNPSALTATVVGCLKGEGANNRSSFTLIIGQKHDLAFSHIRMAGTTARNIKIIGV